MSKIVDIEGVGETYALKLKEEGIVTTEALLEKAAAKKDRESLAAKTGISETLLLRWVNHADLFRISGVAGEYSQLLEAAGVDSAPELAQRNAANLCKKIGEINAEKKLVRKLPVESQIEKWIEQAKQLPKVVTH